MDLLVARRLDANSQSFDSELYNNLAKLGRDYVRAGVSALDYYLPLFDVSNDLLHCLASINPKTVEKVDRGDPQNFIHPMAATELWTLATFVSQILFGGETARRVEPRNPDDEKKADIINELLAWNDAQQPTYTQGFQWTLDSIVQNRGVMYDRWKDIMEVTLEPVEYELPWEKPMDPETGRPAKDPETGKPYRKPKGYEPEKAVRFRKKRKKVGGFVKLDLISPWDFICDPKFPGIRFQEGRFAGHRVVTTWSELKRRSELPPDDYEYVLPEVVKKLKNAKGKRSAMVPAASAVNMSRSNYDRTRRMQSVSTVTGTDSINKDDGGVVECFCIQMRAKPSTYKIFEDEEEEIIEILIANETDLLSVNILTTKHDEYAYCVGEARPSAHNQFSPSWGLIIKGPSDYLNYLQNRHKESLARTSGNIFVGIPEFIDFEAFTDPTKDGLMIPLTQAGVESGKTLDQIIKQIPIVDTTARFYEEMDYWQKTAEQASGAHAQVQGATEDPSQTATQYSGTQQMSEGRITTIARLLSETALVPQTGRIVSNLQQFLDPVTMIRVTGERDDFDPDKPQEKFMTVIRDKTLLEDGTGIDAEGQPIERDPLLDTDIPDIQGYFDVTPHDGSLPGTDAKKVAALSRVIDVAATNPQLAALIFEDTIPGNISLRRTYYKLIKSTGFPIEGLAITREEAMKNLQQKMLATGMGPGMPPPSGPTPDVGIPGIPSAEPPQPSPVG